MHCNICAEESPSPDEEVFDISQAEEIAESDPLSAARDPHMPHHVLDGLSLHTHPEVRKRVAENSGTPSYLLDVLLTDDNISVKRAARQNPKATKEIGL